jgi:prepilin-type N-terminal cleavage/methylation domain-containing protein
MMYCSRTNPLAKVFGSRRGFTLIELLVTILILTIGLLGTAGLTTGIIRGNFFSKNLTSATAIAQTQLEVIENRGYLNATTTNFPSAPQTVPMDGLNYSRTTTITNGTNIKTVSVRVDWTEANNAARSVTLQTILAQ